MMKTQSTITLNFWDILKYKIWDKACKIKGYSDDFTFGSVYENDYEFEFTNEELVQMGVKLNGRLIK